MQKEHENYCSSHEEAGWRKREMCDGDAVQPRTYLYGRYILLTLPGSGRRIVYTVVVWYGTLTGFTVRHDLYSQRNQEFM